MSAYALTSNAKLLARRYLPFYRGLWRLKRFARQDLAAWVSFVRDTSFKLPVADRLWLIRRAYLATSNIKSPHTYSEVLSYVSTILSLPQSVEGVVVEAGCFKGSSTVKFSLAAGLAGRELVVFDSFQGLPLNDDPDFPQGDYWGQLEEVRGNVAKFGRIDCCRFIPGWFDDTMPRFREPIAAVYLDVDLDSSTRTCLKYLYPLLQPGGVLYSQDGHSSRVIRVFEDEYFWLKEVGCKKPYIEGLRTSKLVKIRKG